MEIKLQFQNKILVFELNKNASEFFEMLPLELEFSDYANKEKIASLPQKLRLKDESYVPAIGDLFYFAPWGNIGIFYGKQPPYNGLVLLGKLKNINDIEILKKQDSNFIVRIEKN